MKYILFLLSCISLIQAMEKKEQSPNKIQSPRKTQSDSPLNQSPNRTKRKSGSWLKDLMLANPQTTSEKEMIEQIQRIAIEKEIEAKEKERLLKKTGDSPKRSLSPSEKNIISKSLKQAWHDLGVNFENIKAFETTKNYGEIRCTIDVAKKNYHIASNTYYQLLLASNPQELEYRLRFVVIAKMHQMQQDIENAERTLAIENAASPVYRPPQDVFDEIAKDLKPN